MKEFKFEIRTEHYKIGEYTFNDNFSYNEMMAMSTPEKREELVSILNAHLEDGPKLTGDLPFKKITFISQTLMKGFLGSAGK